MIQAIRKLVFCLGSFPSTHYTHLSFCSPLNLVLAKLKPPSVIIVLDDCMVLSNHKLVDLQSALWLSISVSGSHLDLATYK